MKNKKPIITEKALQSYIRHAALVCGWKFYHTWNSIRSPAGFPDCVMVHGKKGRLIFAELKNEKGRVSEEQKAWLDTLRMAGCEVYLWRPSDMNKAWEVLSG